MSEFSRDIIVEGIGSYLINDDKPYHRVMLANKFWHSSLRLDIGLIAQYMREFSFIYPRELVRTNLLNLKTEDIYPFVTACRKIIPVAKKDEASFSQLENYFRELLNKEYQDNVLIQLMLSLLHRHRYKYYLSRGDETNANQSKQCSQVFAEKIKDKCPNAGIILADFRFADSIDGALVYFKEAMADFDTNKILAKIETSRMFSEMKNTFRDRSFYELLFDPVDLFNSLKVSSLGELLGRFVTFNKDDYVYVRTFTPVAQEDIVNIEQIGKFTFIDDKQVMTYAAFLRHAKIIRSDTQAVMDLLPYEKMKIHCRDGRLCLMGLGEKIQVETRPIERPDKKRKHEDITKHDKPEDAAPAAKRKKMGEEEAVAATGNSNRNSFFQTQANVRDDENGNAENEGDYTMGEPQEGPR